VSQHSVPTVATVACSNNDIGFHCCSCVFNNDPRSCSFPSSYGKCSRRRHRQTDMDGHIRCFCSSWSMKKPKIEFKKTFKEMNEMTKNFGCEIVQRN
jgi:hypothetical protein